MIDSNSISTLATRNVVVGPSAREFHASDQPRVTIKAKIKGPARGRDTDPCLIVLSSELV